MAIETTPLNTSLATGEVPSIYLNNTDAGSNVLTESEIDAKVDASGQVNLVSPGKGITIDATDLTNPIVIADVDQADLDTKASVQMNARLYVDVNNKIGYLTSDGSDPHP